MRRRFTILLLLLCTFPLLAGFRPSGFPNVKLPPEERVKNFDDR